LALVTLVLCVAFVSSDFDWYTSTYTFFTVSAEVDQARMDAGNPARRMAMATIGLLGATLVFLWPSPREGTFRSRTLYLLLAYIALCYASIVWSDIPTLTAKRLVIFGFCILGILGVARHMTAGDLMYMALAISLAFVAIGLLAEISLGSLRPLAGDYRFAGTLHPNGQATVCATLTIAALCIAKSANRAKVLYWFLFAAGFLLLVLTKSRNNLIGCCFAVYAASFLGGSSGLRKFLATGPPFAFCAALLTISLIGFDVGGALEKAMHMGRDTEFSDIGSMTGRVPLWKLMIEYISQQPLLGYGFQSFWTAERMMAISSELDWTVPNAHSAPIDTLLQVGLIGAICFGLGIFSCVGRLTHRCFISGTPDLIFALAMVLYALVTSVLESGFADPSRFHSFIAFSALIQTQTQSGAAA
jgi:O-antigen ligase